MKWISLLIATAGKLPIERLFIKPRDPSKALDELVVTMTAHQSQNKPAASVKPTPNITEPPEIVTKQESVATACVACAVNHFATSAGLLNEAVRFEKEGMTSNEVLDRIAKTLEELNALERVDLTPEKIQGAPEWERELAEEALQQSRSLRHRLESLTTIKELKEAAADTERYYRNLNRRWWKLRLKTEKPLTLEDAKKAAAEEAAKEVEARWIKGKSTT